MRKNTWVLIMVTTLLVIAVGVSIWTVSSRQAPKSSQETPAQTKTFTMNDVARHKSKSDCWTVISGEVYDLTMYVSRHPGGDEIVKACGIDATSLFNSRQTPEGQPVGSGTPHSQAAREQLSKLKIGILAQD